MRRLDLRRLALRASLLTFTALVLASCRREDRNYREIAPGSSALPAARMPTVEPGPRTSDPSVGAFQNNRWAISQGYMLFIQFNCAGCHSPGGGGGMGPPLTDDEWIYGSEPENVFATIVEGRPNGMPSFRGKISNAQIWQLVAFVRSMSGLTPRDTWPGRTDHMQQTEPYREPTPQWSIP